jgi:uncharacterized damage-inducible protein DinB
LADSVTLDRQTFLAEFDHEMAMTRRVLARVPDAAFAWKPHEKSFALGELATHLAVLPHWGRQILEGDFYDVATPSGEAGMRESTAAVLAVFDGHVAEVRRLLVDRPDAALFSPWALKRGRQIVMSMPRLAALRRFLLHHVIHHRGQMTVYLRLQGVAVPPLYGPTADERA